AVDLAHMAQISGRAEEQLLEELAGMIYLDPESGAWVPTDLYLSGNVRAKLKAAEAAAKADPRFQANVEALRQVQPPDLGPGEIKARLGAPWIPDEVIQEFLGHLLNRNPYDFTVKQIDGLAEWVIDVPRWARSWRTAEATSRWGTARVDAIDLVTDALNSRQPTVYDTTEDGTKILNQVETTAARQKLQEIQEEFNRWLWSDPERSEQMVRIYNDRYNNLRLWEPDGSHLTFPGMNPAIELRPHQKNAVWRVVQSGNTLLAHVVGAGKTFEMIASAMELKR